MLLQGFYAVYRQVFEQLAAEDYEFMEDKDSDWQMPGFGDSQSSYEEVIIYIQLVSSRMTYAFC